MSTHKNIAVPGKFNEERLMTVLLAPAVSEKATQIADKHHQVVFRVHLDATKPQVKAAVELLFKVQVDSVQVATLLRAVSVVGWSGPRTRTRSGSSAFNSFSAALASPVSPVKVATLLRAVSVSW